MREGHVGAARALPHRLRLEAVDGLHDERPVCPAHATPEHVCRAAGRWHGCAQSARRQGAHEVAAKAHCDLLQSHSVVMDQPGTALHGLNLPGATAGYPYAADMHSS